MKRRVLLRTLRGASCWWRARHAARFSFRHLRGAKERAASLERADRMRALSRISHRASMRTRSAAPHACWSGSPRAPDGMRRPNIERVLPAILGGFPQIANLGVISSAGRVEYSVVPPPLAVDERQRRLQARARHDRGGRGRLWSAPSSGGRFIHRACRARQRRWRAAHPFRCAGARVAVDLARQADLPPNYALLIVDRNGAVLARSGPPRSPVPIRRCAPTRSGRCSRAPAA